MKPLFLLLMPVALVLAAVYASAAEVRPPNIIIILADDLGRHDLGCYGSKDVRSPNIDRLAKEGVLCTAAYTTAPQCTPSRAGLLSGIHQSRFGVETVIGSQFEKFAEKERWGMPHEIKLFPDYLKPHGYITACVGKWHLGYSDDHNPINHGFDRFVGFLHGGSYFLKGTSGIPILNGTERVVFNKPAYLTDYLTDQAIDFIGANKDRPFFLYLAQFAPHVPLQVTQKYLDRFSDVSNPNRRAFLAMMSALDDGVGRIMDFLKENQLDENTLIFFTSDNGGPTGDNPDKGENTSRNDPFTGVKGDLLEGGIRVPYIVRWAGHLSAGTVYEGPVSTLDFLPTSIAAGGETPPAQLEGMNILPYLDSRKPPLADRMLFWRFGIEMAVRSGDYKLFRPYPGVSEFSNIKENLTEDLAKGLESENPEKFHELDRALTDWGNRLAVPIWKNFFPDVVLRLLERHKYMGYEAYLPGATSLETNKRKWEVTKKLYKESLGVDLDSPTVLTKEASP
jgi:arylsulfatase A-like enzyme